MPDDENPGPRPIPHFQLYTMAVALLIVATACQAIALAEPSLRMLQSPSVILGTSGVVLVAATTLGRRQEMQAHARHREAQIAQQRQDAVIDALGVLAYDLQRLIAHAEKQMGVSHDLSTALDEVGKWVQAMDGDLRQARSQGYVEGVRERLSGEGGSVVGWPRQRT